MSALAVLSPDLLHLRTTVALPLYEFTAPPVFDQARPWGARIKRSSRVFDESFGGKREMRDAVPKALIYHVTERVKDSDILLRFGSLEPAVIGIGQFVWALALCESADGIDFLPPQGESRLIAYIKDTFGHIRVAEAERSSDGFVLNRYEVDEAGDWPEHTYLLVTGAPGF